MKFEAVFIQSLFEKKGLEKILLDKSPLPTWLCSTPFLKGQMNSYLATAQLSNNDFTDWRTKV
jgi:hypothetical protein